MNPVRVFNKYSRNAVDYIHKGPVLAKISELLGEFKEKAVDAEGKTKTTTWSLGDRGASPRLAKWLEAWRDTQTGKVPATSLPPGAQRFMGHIKDNLVSAILSYSFRLPIVQTAALVNTHAMIGTKYTTQGIYDVIASANKGNGKWEYMMEHSNEMPGRYGGFDVATQFAGGKVGKVLGASKAAGKFGLVPAQMMDLVTAAATWMGAYRQGVKLFKENVTRASRYADDVVIKTQGSSRASEISPIQRSMTGKLLTLFQTFAINNWDFFTRDVLGYKNPEVGTKAKMGRAMRLMVGVAMANALYRELGMDPPTPDPVGAAIDEHRAGGSAVDISIEVAKELIEMFPIIGSTAKYSSAPGGPIVDMVYKALRFESNPMGSLDAIAKLAGVPGYGQIRKTTRALSEDRPPFEWLTGGRYKDRPKKPKTITFE
jgi:hypothetical protein